jgi:hypothetical protein
VTEADRPGSREIAQENALHDDLHQTSPDDWPSADLRDALRQLGQDDRALAQAVDRLGVVLIQEVRRSARLRKALKDVCLAATGTTTATRGRSAAGRSAASSGAKRPSRRKPGPWNPFDVYSTSGADGLRERLVQLDLEQLRDILAEHGMDTDRLAMKWRDHDRVIARIVERVEDRSVKGASFRT